MKGRYKSLLDSTRNIKSYDDANGRIQAFFLMWDCEYITIELYIFLKRKIIQSAYLNGVTVFSEFIELYFSNNDIASFNHYVIKDKR